jgi:hypothetical protein
MAPLLGRRRDSARSERAFESALARLESELDQACAAGEEWPANVIAAVRAGFEFAAREPAAARLLVIDSLPDPTDSRPYDRLIDQLAAKLRQASAGHPLPGTLQERPLIGGVLGLVAIRLTLDQAPTLPTVALEAAEFLLAPYLGDEGTRQRIAGAVDRSLSQGS